MNKILFLSILFSSLFAAVHRVPHDRETIQEGINAASTGEHYSTSRIQINPVGCHRQHGSTGKCWCLPLSDSGRRVCSNQEDGAVEVVPPLCKKWGWVFSQFV